MKKYDFYRCHKTVLLDGEWSFKTDFEDAGLKQEWHRIFPADCEKAVVPFCWNRYGERFDRYGVVWYSREFFCFSGNYLLTFNAVNDEAQVFIDGNIVGCHYGGFTAFSFELTGLTEGIHTITVRVDNTKNSIDTLPLKEADWYHYGGIIRSVELMPFSGLYVRELKLCYELQSNKAEVCAEALCSGDGTVEYTLLVEGKSIKRVILQKGVNHISFTLEQVKLWSCENPRLYNITLASDSDSITERTGFRTVCVSENSVLLNGEPIRLKGINRHDEHPDWGFSVPDQLEKRDFELIKQLGCNALRGAHYPQKEYLLDLCDEYGILYWSEIPLWQYRVSNFCEKKVLSRGKTMMCEMITAYYNHPSIFVWGLHNECSTETAEGVNFTRELYNTVKQLDNSRLISYATDRPLEDKCFEFCDFISINKYYGWYEGESSEWKPFLEKLEKMLVKKGFSGKPVVISEFGAAALYGHRTMENEKWTEDYQSRCIENAMKVFAYKPYIVGTFIWQFANLRVDPNRSLDRAHGYNNKGILDEYRRPKKAYYTLMNLYHEK